jgi:DivIVA domain-containing protein
MHPDDITNRDFFVGLRGYDKGEVDRFLADVAAAHADTLAELEELRAELAAANDRTMAVPVVEMPSPEQASVDEIEQLGSAVVAVLQSARDTAAEILRKARDEADFALEAARAEAEQIRQEVSGSALQAKDEAERIAAEAQVAARNAREQADVYAESRRGVADDYARQTRQEADEYAARVRGEAEAHRDGIEARVNELVRTRTSSLEHQVRTAVEAAVAETNERLNSAYAEIEVLRSQMLDAAEGIQLALMALGNDPQGDARVGIEQAVPVQIDLTETTVG